MKIDASCFSTNRQILNKDVLRYCESFYQYLYHLINFFGETLQINELRWLNFIIQRLELFLNDAPTTDKYVSIVSRYQRLLPKLKRIYNEQSSVN